MTPTDVTTRPEWRAFLSRIILEPAEDVHRLVAADWLEEHGEPQRAEFIRGQIRWDAVACVGVSPPPPDEPSDVAARFLASIARRQEHTFLCDRCRQMPPGHLARPRWMPPGFYAETRRTLHSGDMVPFIPETTFRRGFADEIRCSAAHWLSHADLLVWSPEQTAECPQIKWRVVAGTVDPGTRKRAVRDGLSGPCPKWCKGGCSGTGRVARPCPPTAQPITKVNLTTWPNIAVPVIDAEDWATMSRVTAAVLIAEELGKRHRGITFTLPPA